MLKQTVIIPLTELNRLAIHCDQCGADLIVKVSHSFTPEKYDAPKACSWCHHSIDKRIENGLNALTGALITLSQNEGIAFHLDAKVLEKEAAPGGSITVI